MPRIGIITGLLSEAEIPRAASRYATPETRPSHASIAGRAASASEAVDRMLAEGPIAGLVSFGMAGGLAPALAPGTVLLPDRVIDSDGTAYPVDAAWRQALAEAVAETSVIIRRDPLLGSDQAVACPGGKASLHDSTGAVAVDMESHGVARAARQRGLPFLVVRAVADPAEKGLPPAALAGMGPNGETRALAVMLKLLTRPGDLPRLIGLAGEARRATASLRRVCLIGGPDLLVPGLISGS